MYWLFSPCAFNKTWWKYKCISTEFEAIYSEWHIYTKVKEQSLTLSMSQGFLKVYQFASLIFDPGLVPDHFQRNVSFVNVKKPANWIVNTTTTNNNMLWFRQPVLTTQNMQYTSLHGSYKGGRSIYCCLRWCFTFKTGWLDKHGVSTASDKQFH